MRRIKIGPGSMGCEMSSPEQLSHPLPTSGFSNWLLEKSLGTPSVLQSTMTAVLAAGEILGTPSVLPSTMTAVLSAGEMSRHFLCLTKYNDCSTGCYRNA